jgi:hypothetical protein
MSSYASPVQSSRPLRFWQRLLRPSALLAVVLLVVTLSPSVPVRAA